MSMSVDFHASKYSGAFTASAERLEGSDDTILVRLETSKHSDTDGDVTLFLSDDNLHALTGTLRPFVPTNERSIELSDRQIESLRSILDQACQEQREMLDDTDPDDLRAMANLHELRGMFAPKS
jgi:hypothetical protein